MQKHTWFQKSAVGGFILSALFQSCELKVISSIEDRRGSDGPVVSAPSPSASPAPSATPRPSVSPSPSPSPAAGARVCDYATHWDPWPLYGDMNIQCPAGQVVQQVQFASYGTSTGSCGAFAVSQCHEATTQQKVEALCLGKGSCTTSNFDAAFGDPCPGIDKHLNVQVVCGTGGVVPSPTPRPTATPSPTVAPTATPTPSGTPVATPVPQPTASGGNTAVNLPVIPYSDPDIIGPGRGLEFWIYQWVVPNPLPTSSYNTLDRYDRFEWRSFQNDDPNSYNFAEFDASIREAINAGQKFSFGVMNLCSACSDFVGNVGGGRLTYPNFLHNQMQAEAQKDRNAGGFWVPNWNSANYKRAWRNMLVALGQHISRTSYNGVPYSKVVDRIDIRGYGDFGEWHNYPYSDNPAENGGPATAATLNELIDAHVAAFPNFQLQVIVNIFDTGGWSGIPAAVAYRAATGSNSKGRFGWRKDSWGATESYWNNPLSANTASYNGVNLWSVIQNIWREAPVTGEPYQCCTANGGSQLYWDLERQTRFYHLTSLGNGNLENGGSSATQNAMRASAKAMGYRINLNGGQFTSSVGADKRFTTQLRWRNVGVAPLYDDWDTMVELRNSAGAVVWTGKTSLVLKHYLPEATDRQVVDTFTLPSNVAAGSYRLHLVIKDPANYRKPLPIANTGRASDGSYFLGNVSVQ